MTDLIVFCRVNLFTHAIDNLKLITSREVCQNMIECNSVTVFVFFAFNKFCNSTRPAFLIRYRIYPRKPFMGCLTYDLDVQSHHDYPEQSG